MSAVCKTEKLCLLEKKINSGKKVILTDCDDISFLKFLVEEISKKYLSNLELWHCASDISDRDFVKIVKPKEMLEILETYHIYDFSDRIIVLSEAVQYGNLFNYVKTGILTESEMVQALLCKI